MFHVPAVYFYSIIVETSYYKDLREREGAVIVGPNLATPAFSPLNQRGPEVYPTHSVPEEYRPPAPYAQACAPPMPLSYPVAVPAPGIYYAEQSQASGTAPPFPYGAPPPYVPVQDSGVYEKPPLAP